MGTWRAAEANAVMLTHKQPPTPSTLTKQDSRSRDAVRAGNVEREQEMPAEVRRAVMCTWHPPPLFCVLTARCRSWATSAPTCEHMNVLNVVGIHPW